MVPSCVADDLSRTAELALLSVAERRTCSVGLRPPSSAQATRPAVAALRQWATLTRRAKIKPPKSLRISGARLAGRTGLEPVHKVRANAGDSGLSLDFP